MGNLFGKKNSVVVYYTSNPKAAPIKVSVAEGETVESVLELLHGRHGSRIYDGPGEDCRGEGTTDWRGTKTHNGQIIRILGAVGSSVGNPLGALSRAAAVPATEQPL
jgi:hypothetical protein